MIPFTSPADATTFVEEIGTLKRQVPDLACSQGTTGGQTQPLADKPIPVMEIKAQAVGRDGNRGNRRASGYRFPIPYPRNTNTDHLAWPAIPFVDHIVAEEVLQ